MRRDPQAGGREQRRDRERERALAVRGRVATVANGTEYGNSGFCSATGVESTPLTVPVIVSPVPHTGRIVDGVIATPVGTREVVNVRLEPRVTPAALVATARYL